MVVWQAGAMWPIPASMAMGSSFLQAEGGMMKEPRPLSAGKTVQ